MLLRAAAMTQATRAGDALMRAQRRVSMRVSCAWCCCLPSRCEDVDVVWCDLVV